MIYLECPITVDDVRYDMIDKRAVAELRASLGEASRELIKSQESYWNLSRSMKLTQEERDTAESRVRELEAELQRFRNLCLDVERQRDRTGVSLAAATALLVRWERSFSAYELSTETRAFLANQPAAPTPTIERLKPRVIQLDDDEP